MGIEPADASGARAAGSGVACQISQRFNEEVNRISLPQRIGWLGIDEQGAAHRSVDLA